MSDEWTTGNLKEWFIHEIESLRAENDRRFSAQEKAVETAFSAAKEAVLKSEQGVEKRSDAVYVTIAKLQEALALVMPRAESEQRYTTLLDKIGDVSDTQKTTEGKSNGLNQGWAILLGVAGLASIIIGTIIAIKG